MPRGNVGETVGGMFDDLKSRLGFNGGDSGDESGGRGGYDDYDDYDEYSDFDEYAEYGDAYEDDAPVGGYRPLTSRSTSAGRFSADITSNLVSINDVKATTPFPDLPARGQSAYSDPYPVTNAGTHGVAGATAPATSSPAYTSQLRDFPQQGGTAGSVSGVSASTQASTYDPYEAYASSSPSTHVPTRSLTVVKPVAYGDVERVAKAVKAGDVVVLAMRNTPDDLSKRILDFSFGVASALDANVECPAEKVFAIARGNALTPEEKRKLASQGVL